MMDRPSTLWIAKYFIPFEAAVGAALALGVATGCTGSVIEPPSQRGGDTPGAGAGGGNSMSGGGGPNTPGGPSAPSGPTAPGTNGDGTFTCGSDAKLPEASLRRLTMAQYRSTVRDLVGWATGSDAAAIAEIQPALDGLPADRREPTPRDLHGSFRRLDQTLQQVHVDALYAVGVSVGAALTSNGRLARLAGACATDGDAANDAECRDAFIRGFGERALRRPLTSAEVDFYRSVYGSAATADPAAYADVVTVMLNAPEFVYFVEHGDEPVAGQRGTYELSAHELASRLSYQLWQTAPDAELRAAAANDSLLDPAVYARQVERLTKDARAQVAFREFVEDWLKVEDLPALDAKNADAVYKAFAGADLPGAALRGAMIEDVVGMVDYYTWKKPGPFAELFTSEKSFAKDPALAKIYGVSPWDGSSSPPSLPAGQRPGFLTRALFLASASSNTRPIMKGVFIRRNVLCDEIPPPPPGANAVPPELSPTMTTREVVEELTEGAGTTCAGCHRALINPLGFATENFDALGRYRVEQALFDAAGQRLGTGTVDTRGVPRVTASDDTQVAGASELMQKIVESGKAEACVSRNYFRFTFGRWEDSAVDGCALESMRSKLAEGRPIAESLQAVVLAPAFKRRAFE